MRPLQKGCKAQKPGRPGTVLAAVGAYGADRKDIGAGIVDIVGKIIGSTFGGNGCKGFSVFFQADFIAVTSFDIVPYGIFSAPGQICDLRELGRRCGINKPEGSVCFRRCQSLSFYTGHCSRTERRYVGLEWRNDNLQQRKVQFQRRAIPHNPRCHRLSDIHCLLQ